MKDVGRAAVERLAPFLDTGAGAAPDPALARDFAGVEFTGGRLKTTRN
jgi:hypothetical protein